MAGRCRAYKHKTAVTEQIIKALRRHAGVEMNIHLFRHLAGKLLLQQIPGNYELVRRLLGRRSIDTTTVKMCVPAGAQTCQNLCRIRPRTSYVAASSSASGCHRARFASV